MTSVIMAFSDCKLVGCLDPAEYEGAEHPSPHGWKELIDRGITFDQVDVDLPSEEMARHFLDHFRMDVERRQMIRKKPPRKDTEVRKHQFGRLVIEGNANFAKVIEEHDNGHVTVLEEFDNRFTTDTKEPNAFKRALMFAESLHS